MPHALSVGHRPRQEAAAVSVESMILCPAASEAQVSRDAGPISIANMLVGALTGDQAMQEAPPALVIRVENVYEQGEEYFAIDAQADWELGELEFTVLGKADSRPRYRVEAFVANYSEFMARSAMDWERFTPAMMDRLNTGVG